MNLQIPADLPPELQRSTTRHHLSPGQILLQQGEPAADLYWVVVGQLRLVSFFKQQMITHYWVEAGELLGESALEFETYGCTAIAEVSSEVIALPKEKFAAALTLSPMFSGRYLTYLTRRFQSVKTLLELRTIHSAKDRLLYYLVQRRSADQQTVMLEKPLKVIASELALAPESLSRLLARLEVEGIITRKKRSISLSKEWLESVAH